MTSFQSLNAIEEFEEKEWVNPNASPHTDSISEGLEWLEQGLPQEEIDRIHAEVQMEMEKKDPRKQSYFMRLDTKSVIKTEKEYDFCVENSIPTEIISYSRAVQILKVQDAKKRAVQKERRKKKMAKKSRRKNR